MNKIKLLSKDVYSKIAAGEVIDRPAAVVRELIDNAIDAGSDTVSILIENGGIDKITVIDNGSGIYRDDLPLALSMHATSKIENFDDLLMILTMGFRGEALHSIQTVSKTEITSNTDASGLKPGYKISNEDLSKVHGVSFKKGTKVEISDIFYNIPARKKFLKSRLSEFNAVKNTIITKVFSFPDISFKFYHDSKAVFSTKGDGDFNNAFFNVFNNENRFDIFMHVKEISKDIKIKIYFSLPDIYFSNRRYTGFFVNGRAVSANFFYPSLDGAVRNFISPGRYTLVYVYIDINPGLLDINIHPAKKEIKFHDHNLMFKLIQDTLIEAYSGKIIRNIVKNDYNAVEQSVDNTVNEKMLKEKQNYFEYFNQINISGRQNTGFSINKEHDDYSILGTVFDTYIVIQKDQKVIFIDQHAACEAIIYKEKTERFKSVRSSEQLLIPLIIDADGTDIDLDKKINDLNNNFFYAEKQEGNAVVIKEVPSILTDKKDYNLISEIIRDYLHSEYSNLDIIKNIIIKLSCSEAVKKGDKLNAVDIASIVDGYFANNITNCPHGRPAHFEINREYMEKVFQRKL